MVVFILYPCFFCVVLACIIANIEPVNRLPYYYYILDLCRVIANPPTRFYHRETLEIIYISSKYKITIRKSNWSSKLQILWCHFYSTFILRCLIHNS